VLFVERADYPWAGLLPPALWAWPLVWWIIATNIQGTMRHLVALAVVFAPICWVSSFVMCQDEAISTGIFAAITIALLRHRLGLAMFLCGVAVVVAKIYFLVPLVGLIRLAADRSWGTWLRQGFVGIAAIMAVYGLQALLTSRQGQGVNAFSDFAPPAAISISVWVIIDQLVTLSAQHAKSVSGILALASSMLPLWLFRKRSFVVKPIDQARVLVAMMLWVFGIFYLINPEYCLLVVSGNNLVLRPIATIWTIFVLFSFRWAVNFVYAVANGIALGSEERNVLLRIDQSVLPWDPKYLQNICVAVSAVVTIGLAWSLSFSCLIREVRSGAPGS
jgi:hypothetical protein